MAILVAALGIGCQLKAMKGHCGVPACVPDNIFDNTAEKEVALAHIWTYGQYILDRTGSPMSIIKSPVDLNMLISGENPCRQLSNSTQKYRANLD